LDGKVLGVARTIADLEGYDDIKPVAFDPSTLFDTPGRQTGSAGIGPDPASLASTQLLRTVRSTVSLMAAPLRYMAMTLPSRPISHIEGRLYAPYFCLPSGRETQFSLEPVPSVIEAPAVPAW